MPEIFSRLSSALLIRKFKPSADNGDANSQYILGVLYNNGGALINSHKKAATCYKKAAEQRHPEAQFYLGNLLQQGKGVTQDYKEAASYYYKSAKQGNIKAALHLGRLFETGKGVSQDYAKAGKLYLVAAKNGDKEAQYYLGRLYHSGSGLPQDDVKASEWLEKASQNGHQGALSLLKEINGGQEPLRVEESEIELMPDDKDENKPIFPVRKTVNVVVYTLLTLVLAPIVILLLLEPFSIFFFPSLSITMHPGPSPSRLGGAVARMLTLPVSMVLWIYVLCQGLRLFMIYRRSGGLKHRND